jgi:6,7-dimethyl-8-ribityllumazine synthase
MRFAIVMSRYNDEITSGLFRGALGFLKEHGVTVREGDVFAAPGAFEIPLLARQIAKTQRYAGVICLGCVIKGDTAHFEYISEATAHGLMTASLETSTPIAFGILTTYTEEQALIRSRDDSHNKGREAANACFEAARTVMRISELA